MDYALICSVALVASGLTFFTGFGLGTLLLPAFAVFFPVEVAVGLTAAVHFLNSLFKLALVGRHADLRTVLRFGLPAILAAFVGAWVLIWLSGLRPIVAYQLGARALVITPVKLAVALLMLLFASFEVVPRFKKLSVPSGYLPLGGLLTGFFGGLSGHQGALRSAFLIRAGLSKEAFIATGVVIAALVDASRLAVYSKGALTANLRDNGPLLAAATAAAFAGALLGNRLLHKVTLRAIEIAVALLLVVIAIGLGVGFL